MAVVFMWSIFLRNGTNHSGRSVSVLKYDQDQNLLSLYSSVGAGWAIMSLPPSSRSPCVPVCLKSVRCPHSTSKLQAKLIFVVVPPIFRGLRRVVYCLCAIIISLGVAESLVWLFQCLPVGSNFNFYIEQTSCINVDYPRYGPSTLTALHSWEDTDKA